MLMAQVLAPVAGSGSCPASSHFVVKPALSRQQPPNPASAMCGLQSNVAVAVAIVSVAPAAATSAAAVRCLTAETLLVLR